MYFRVCLILARRTGKHFTLMSFYTLLSSTFHSATEHSSRGLVWFGACEFCKRETK